jgi:hypothetical protein
MKPSGEMKQFASFGRFLIKVLAFGVVALNFARRHESTSEHFYRH